MENTSVKIVIVNGSHRKNGATAGILNEMYRQLKKCGWSYFWFAHLCKQCFRADEGDDRPWTFCDGAAALWKICHKCSDL